jgi:hypothetical protein
LINILNRFSPKRLVRITSKDIDVPLICHVVLGVKNIDFDFAMKCKLKGVFLNSKMKEGMGALGCDSPSSQK